MSNRLLKALLLPLALISLCSCDVKIMPPLKEILSFHGFLTSLETMEDAYRKRSGAVNLPSGLFYDYPGYVYRVLKKMNPETFSKEPTTSMEWTPSTIRQVKAASLTHSGSTKATKAQRFCIERADIRSLISLIFQSVKKKGTCGLPQRIRLPPKTTLILMSEDPLTLFPPLGVMSFNR